MSRQTHSPRLAGSADVPLPQGSLMPRFGRGPCRLTIAAGLVAVGARALALDARDVLVYNLGPVRLRPHVTASEKYDDNIFYQGNKSPPGVSAEADFITTVSPAL